MKKEDKELIYDLLKKTDAYVTGYTSQAFAVPMSFEDDGELDQQVEKTVVSEPVEGPTTNDALTLDNLKSKILRCTKCPLARTRNNVVPGEGVEHPDVLVIGEGPGYDEDMSGRPFVGKAGVLLDKMLAAIGLDRNTNCYIANVVKCRPPNNRDPEPAEQSACSGFLEAQIHILKPKMILCMGRIAGHKMLDSQSPLNQLRGQFHDYNGIPLMVTYHPSALLRDQALKAPAWEDLKAFRRRLNEITGQ
ncbi:MAG: uracil-DNA glycosylase [Treponema sp.]|nr:uracil-DNA glycosylase [Treponema sp.]